MSNYDKIQQPVKGDFYKLQAGENRIRLVSEPESFGSHYVTAEKKSFICLGKSECNWCKVGDKPRARFYYWVIDRKDGVIKLAEFGWAVIGEVKALHDSAEYSFDDVPPYDLIITKLGTGMDTEYKVMASRTNVALTSEEAEKVKALKPLSELVEAKKGVTLEVVDVSAIPF